MGYRHESRALLCCTLSTSFLPSPSIVLTSDLFQIFWRHVHFGGTSRVCNKCRVFVCVRFHKRHTFSLQQHIAISPSFSVPTSLLPSHSAVSYPNLSPVSIRSSNFFLTGIKFTPNFNTNMNAKRYAAGYSSTVRVHVPCHHQAWV